MTLNDSSEDPSATSRDAGNNVSQPASLREYAANSSLELILKRFFENQAERDGQAQARQAERDEQAQARQAERDEQAQAKQAERDAAIFRALDRQAMILERLEQKISEPKWLGKQPVSATSDAYMLKSHSMQVGE
ncbi:hypothetical protein H4217_003656 [Coemansia sp. RSA 1939]|nr:hypothetical protein H4217_003656 [Coemansia sp. RSA 1939]